MLRTLLCAMLLLVPAAARSQEAAPPPACEAEPHHRFDFWIGDWVVVGPRGDTIGDSRIEAVSAGCALLENWTSRGGADGKSINFYDAKTDRWHQVWVGGGGLILRLTGGPDADGAMVLVGEPRETPQGVVRDRITWTPRPDGSVVQAWDVAPVGTGEWRETFRGVYRPR